MTRDLGTGEAIGADISRLGQPESAFDDVNLSGGTTEQRKPGGRANHDVNLYRLPI